MSSECPVCKSEVSRKDESPGPDGRKHTWYSCPRCGDYDLMDVDPSILQHTILNKDIQKIAALSHWIRTRHESIRKEPRDNQGKRRANALDRELIESIIKDTRPSLPVQVNNSIRWIGDNINVGGQYIDVDEVAIQAIVGAATFEEFELVFRRLKDKGLIEQKPGNGNIWFRATLSFAGWELYDELKRSTSESRKAFMAMPYGKKDLDAIVENVFKPAVKETGFDLSRLDDPDQPAGLIDDALRIAVRTSRFLIADLTHENRGAYWEAGYAEGLGKHVIYTCEKKKFKKLKTHFDTNHYLTIEWDSGNLQEAGKKLKNTIRATLPAEARLTDD